MAGVNPVRRALARAVAELERSGVASPRADAEQLAAHVLGIPRGRLALVDTFPPPAAARFQELVARRAERVPLQHLTGTVGFGELELAVGPGVFIPRPETELLAQWAVAQPASVVVDLGSGTGALALSIAHARPQARVYAVEASAAARAWLRRNAADRARAGDRPIEVVAGDATDPAVLSELDGTVDLVVCNPPYVPDGVPVPPEVAEHEPPEAVFAGADGLAVIRPVLARAAALLRPGGQLGIEHDQTHGEAVPALMRRWFTDVVDHRDLAGRPRYATGRRMAD